MSLTGEQIGSIRRIVGDTAGPAAQVRVFGSRLRDDATGVPHPNENGLDAKRLGRCLFLAPWDGLEPPT
jgi:hypothetical protein